MQSLVLKCLVACVAALLGTPALACSCAPEGRLVSAVQARGLPPQFEAVFLGRVSRVVSQTEAHAEVLEAFLGTSGTKRLVSSGHTDDCGVTFALGEEYIFMPLKGGYVIWCWRVSATPENIAAVRAAAKVKR